MNIVEESALAGWVESVLALLRQDNFIYSRDIIGLFRACDHKLASSGDLRYIRALRARILESARVLNLETDNKKDAIKILERVLNEY